MRIRAGRSDAFRTAQRERSRRAATPSIDVIYGINPVLEALRAGRVTEIRVGDRADSRVREVIARASADGVPVRRVALDVLGRQARGGLHQSVVADVEAGRAWSVEDLVRQAPGVPLIVVLDGIEDPHNLGAILRTADAAGVDGVVRQSRRTAPLGGTTAKASAGAVVHVRIADVVNIARAIDALKALGLWVVGLADDAAQPYDRIDFTGPAAVVLGAEGVGLRRLVREKCDFLAAIPMRGHVKSLNVSVAAGIVLFEAVRQRLPEGASAAGRPHPRPDADE
jgi:23S rRNA (guanosine2251-2'-O)-methyltransferase